MNAQNYADSLAEQHVVALNRHLLAFLDADAQFSFGVGASFVASIVGFPLSTLSVLWLSSGAWAASLMACATLVGSVLAFTLAQKMRRDSAYRELRKRAFELEQAGYRLRIRPAGLRDVLDVATDAADPTTLINFAQIDAAGLAARFHDAP